MKDVRLRIVPIVLFSLLAVFAFGSAMPVPHGDVPAQLLPMLPLAAIGISCATLLALFAHPAVTAALLPASAAAAFLLGGDPIAALWTLALFMPVLVLRRAIAAGQAATPTLLQLAGACGLAVLPEIYVTLGRAWATWTPAAMLDRAVRELSGSLQAVEFEVSGETLGYSAEQADEIATLFITLLPALLLLLCAAMAWLAWRLTRLLFRLHGLDRHFTPTMSTITMSRIGAVIFLCAALLSLLGGDELELTEALALNLLLLLEPPLVLIGIDGINAAMRRRDSINGSSLVLLILMLLTCNLSILLLILALIGVIRTFRRKPGAPAG